jgi:hypothetical protein
MGESDYSSFFGGVNYGAPAYGYGMGGIYFLPSSGQIAGRIYDGWNITLRMINIKMGSNLEAMANYWRQQHETGLDLYESGGIIRQGGPFGPIVGERGLEQSNILFDLITLGTGIKAVFSISKTLIMKRTAKTSSRAFFSGTGTEAKAIEQGFQTLSQTRAGQNLMKLTEGMSYYPGSQSYNWLARLSATYAKGIPNGNTVNAFLNNPSATGIWNAVEKPLLQQRGITIIENVVK